MEKNPRHWGLNVSRGIKLLILCVLCAGANDLCHHFFQFLGLPMFMDTLFTMGVTFYAGPFWGCVTAFLTPLRSILSYDIQRGLYVLCSASGVFLVHFFRHRYHLLQDGGDHDAFNLVSILLMLSLYMCIVISVTGGLISWIISVFWPVNNQDISPESYFKLGMLLNHYPAPLAEIISRLPVNIPDRLLSVYGAYGFALLLKKAARRFTTFRSSAPGETQSP
jgi:hypothetical protein